MNTSFILLQAAPGGGGYSMIIMLVIMFAIMWFFMIRPQQKKQKEIRNFQNSITIGTQVYTQGGIVGKVKSINEAENTLVVESGNSSFVVFRNCVYSNAPVQGQA